MIEWLRRRAMRLDRHGSGHRWLCRLLGRTISAYGGSFQVWRAPWGARWDVYAVSCGRPTAEYSRDQAALRAAMDRLTARLEASGALKTFVFTGEQLRLDGSSDNEAAEVLEQWRDAMEARELWQECLEREDRRIFQAASRAYELGISLRPRRSP